MRLFIGIPLSDAARAELAAVVAQLRHAARDLRWTTPDTWHVTLQFLGNTISERLECLNGQLSQLNCAPVTLQFGSLGAFERAGIAYIDVDLTPELAKLQQRVIAATAQCGFTPEERPFHPHITLARARGKRRFKGVPVPGSWRESPPRFTVTKAREFLLYESFTKPAGAHYEVRARFTLSA